MSASPQGDPRVDQAAITDESLLATHERLLGKQPDEKGRYKLGPLNLLFLFSFLIFFAGTYLNRYSGYFDPHIYHPLQLPTSATPVAAAPIDPLVAGKKVYTDVCMACHQANGQGLPPAFPPLTDSEWVTGSEERLIRIALHGLQGPVTVKGVEYNGAMPPTGPGSGFNLTPERLAAVLTYVRQEFGGGASPISAEKVAEIRAKEGNRGMWTAAELQNVP